MRQSRQAQLDALEQALTHLKAKVGQPYYRTLKCVRRSANACCHQSKVGRFMSVHVYETMDGQIDLQWQIDTQTLWQVEQHDGRYLLVTNDWNLSPGDVPAISAKGWRREAVSRL